MGFFTPHEPAELNKLVEVEGEIRDFIRHREDCGAEGRYVANKLAVLIERVTENSVREIDGVTAGLEALRDELQLQGERVQRDVVEYASLSQSTMQSAKVICEKLAQWNQATSAVVTGPESLPPDSSPPSDGLRV